jgi:hypothetical protein
MPRRLSLAIVAFAMWLPNFGYRLATSVSQPQQAKHTLTPNR